MGRRARVAGALAFVAKAVAFLTLGLVCVAAVCLMLLDTAPVKAFVASRVNAVLKKQFEGTIVVEHIGHLGIWGASGIRARFRLR